MSIDGLFAGTVVVLEWVSCTCTFTDEHLLIHWLVTFGQRVESTLAHCFELLLLRLLQVLPVRTTFRFACHCVIVRCEYFLDEVNNFWCNLPCATTVGKVRNQSNVATSIASFGILIQLSPVTLGACRDGRCTHRDLHLLVLVILVGIADPIAELRCCQIHLACAIQPGLSFRSDTGARVCPGSDDFAIVNERIKGRSSERKRSTSRFTD